jgi:hypothetical protein
MLDGGESSSMTAAAPPKMPPLRPATGNNAAPNHRMLLLQACLARGRSWAAHDLHATI